MRMGNFEGKEGRPIGRSLRQPLSGPFIQEKCSLRLVSRFLFYWAQGVASMRQEEPTALNECVAFVNMHVKLLSSEAFFQPKMKKYR